jgi:multiple sugar transport system substrate-binding protein
MHRSRVLASAVALSIAGGGIAAVADAPDRLTIISHRVHNTVATGAQGGDVTAAWTDATGIGVEWVTMETGPLHERLFRELSLPETSIDVAFLLNTRAVEGIAEMLEPLDAHHEANPVEDIDDVFPGLIEAMRFDGRLHGIPFRHASSCFHYNERLLAERGVEVPTTMEAVIEAAYELTHEDDEGNRVYGFIVMGDNYANIVDLARGWNGDFITLDYELAVLDEGMTKAFQTMADFYAEGVLPTGWAAIQTEEVNTWMQTGRAAMTLTSCGRHQIYNNPETSQEAGNIKTIAMPMSADLADRFDVAPAKVEFWTMVIPANSRHKDYAWDLIRHMASKESTLMAALNGNGPVRASTYDDPKIREMIPYAEEERAVLLVGRVPLPPFDQAARAADVFVEELQAAVLGMKPVEDALAAIDRRVRPLLPTSQ